MADRHIFLYGPPGSGKTSAGKVLARSLNCQFIDLDAAVEKEANSTIPAIMAEYGENRFRALESAALARAVEGSVKVISLGGGALLQARNRDLVEVTGVVIYLETKPETLISRLKADKNTRPLLAGSPDEMIARLLSDRASHYEAFENKVVTTGRSVAQVAGDIQELIGHYHVRGMGRGYDVLIRPNGYQDLVLLLEGNNLKPPFILVTDTNVAPLHGSRLLEQLKQTFQSELDVQMISLPAGEINKNLLSVTKLWQFFLEAGLDRNGTVLALGGGVIGDLAGFAASTFMRGVAWVNLPTSLLAMVDASIGGKSGFDLPEGKNLIGTFYPPALVLVNPDVLATLPEAELRSGLAEVVKHGVIANPGLFEMCSRGFEVARANIQDLVKNALAVKTFYIERDPFETGIRAELNYGHTVGHALELVTGFNIRHGEAVSIGMVAEARLSERLGMAPPGLSDTLAAALTHLGLPTQIPADLSRSALIDALKVDKKRQHKVTHFSLPLKIGRVEAGIKIENLELVFEEDK